MNIHKLRTVLLSALIAICSIGTVQAQQTVSVNGASCPGATVTFGANSIAINTSNCVGTPVTVPTVNASTPPAGTTGAAYSATFTASGSTPLTWSVTGNVPGLTLNSSSGVLSGTPTTVGTYPLSITASNSGGSSAALAVSVSILPQSGPPTIQNTAPSSATVGVSYSFQYAATGAAGITYSASAGLPPGITLTSGGLLSGVPTQAGTFPATVTATNGTLPDATQNVTITVSAPVAPAVTSGTPPGGSTGTTYNFAFTASGTAPITWTVAAGGTLPPGVTLSSAGALSGTPTTAGTYTFAVQAANAAGNALAPATGTYSVVIANVVVGLQSLEGTVIPTPSKQPNASGVTHAGLNGGGTLMNAWAVDPARCNSPSTSPATTPAITRSWHHNIDFDSYGNSYSNDFFDMAPNEELTYKFVPSQLGIGTITLGETTWGPLPATFITMSSKPCDFDYTKLNNGASRDYCYKSATRDNGIYFEVTAGAPSSISYCKLVPGQTYYFNVRFQDGRIPAAGGVATDSCAANGSPRCAGLFQIGR